MVSSATAWRRTLLVLAVGIWLTCFTVLLRWGTWTPFAFAGPTLAALALGFDGTARALLRPSLGKVGVGLLAGMIMVALTHAAFAVVTALVPATRIATGELYALLNVVGFSRAARVGLITVIATSEEVVFRGALVGPAGARDPGWLGGTLGGTVDRHGLLQLLVLAVVYAAGTLTLHSWLLCSCALGCGVVWGALRLWTRSLVTPIITHVVWDLGVLILWPLG